MGVNTGLVDSAVGGDGHGVFGRAAVEGEMDGLDALVIILASLEGDGGGTAQEAEGRCKNGDELHGVWADVEALVQVEIVVAVSGMDHSAQCRPAILYPSTKSERFLPSPLTSISVQSNRHNQVINIPSQPNHPPGHAYITGSQLRQRDVTPCLVNCGATPGEYEVEAWRHWGGVGNSTAADPGSAVVLRPRVI